MGPLYGPPHLGPNIYQLHTVKIGAHRIDPTSSESKGPRTRAHRKILGRMVFSRLWFRGELDDTHEKYAEQTAVIDEKLGRSPTVDDRNPA